VSLQGDSLQDNKEAYVLATKSNGAGEFLQVQVHKDVQR